MTTFKKALAILLAAVTVLALCPLSAFAHTFSDVSEYDEAITLLSDIEVIKGYSSTSFGPKDNVTRWQMALLISKIMSGDVSTERWWMETSNQSTFTDVESAHYLGSILYAAEHGVILGRGNGIFDPTTGITVQEGLTMVIRALGHGSSALDAGWPETYIEKAQELKLLNGVRFFDYEQTMTRGQTAQLLYNVLYAARDNGKTYAETSFNLTSDNDTLVMVVATENARIDTSVSFAKSGTVTVKELQNDGELGKSYNVKASTIGITDIAASLGQVYGISVSDTTVTSGSPLAPKTITSGLTVNGTQGTLTVDGKTYTTVKTKYSYTLKNGTAPSNPEIIVYGLNDAFKTPGVITAANMVGTTAYFTLTGFDVNGDGYLDRAVYTPYSFGQYTAANYKDVTLTGAAVKDGDYMIASYVKETETLYVYKALELKEDTITANDDSSMTINGTKYTYGNDELPGAAKAIVAKGLKTTKDAYRNQKASYVALDGKLLLVEAKAAYTGSYVSRANCAVVTADATATNGTVTVKLAMNSSLPVQVVVSTINGTAAINYYTNLKTGDIVEYAPDPANASQYALTEITSTPALVTNAKTAITYENTYLVFGGSDKIPVLNSTVVFWFDGTKLDFYSATDSNLIGKSVPKNYSVYVAYSLEGISYATFLYIRPTDSSVGEVINTGDIYADELAVIAATPTVSNGTVIVAAYAAGGTNAQSFVATTIDGNPAAAAYATLAAGTVVKCASDGIGYALTTVSTPSDISANKSGTIKFSNYTLTFASKTNASAAIPVDTNTILVVYNGSTFTATKVNTSTAVTLPANTSIWASAGTNGVAKLVYLHTGSSSGNNGGTATGNLNVSTTAVVSSVALKTNYVEVGVYLPIGMSYTLNVTKINGGTATLNPSALAVGDVVTYSLDSTSNSYFVTKVAAASATTNASGTITRTADGLSFVNASNKTTTAKLATNALVLVFNGTSLNWATGNMNYTAAQQIFLSNDNPASFAYIRPSTAPVNPTNPTNPSTPTGTGTLAIVISSEPGTIADEGYATMKFQNLSDGSYVTHSVTRVGSDNISTSKLTGLPTGTLVRYSELTGGKYTVTAVAEAHTAGDGTMAFNEQANGLVFMNKDGVSKTISVTLGQTKLLTFNGTGLDTAVTVAKSTTQVLGEGAKVYVVDNFIYIK